MNSPTSKSSGLVILARGLLQIFYPNLCWICRQPIPPEQNAICQSCREALFTDSGLSCPRCAATVGPFSHLEPGCPACEAAGFAFDRAVRLGTYDGSLREVILRMKDARNEGLAEIIAGLWATDTVEKLRALAIDCVVPVPLHWWRRWQRGYNQSDALAQALAKALQRPFFPYGLRRLRQTPMQVGLSVTKRRDNVRGAFAARRSIKVAGKTVLLVDDVMTTGSTAHEAARAVRRARRSPHCRRRARPCRGLTRHSPIPHLASFFLMRPPPACRLYQSGGNNLTTITKPGLPLQLRIRKETATLQPTSTLTASILRYGLVLALGFAWVGTASASNWADSLFDELSRDFGTVPHGPTLTHPFRIVNKTNATVQIASVRVSCGCTTARASSKHACPGPRNSHSHRNGHAPLHRHQKRHHLCSVHTAQV